MNYQISFAETKFSPVELPAGSALSENMTVQNSPILFGCRIGICGTCAVEILEGLDTLHPRTQNEKEFLDTMAPGKTNYRLACQIEINTNIKLRKVQI